MAIRNIVVAVAGGAQSVATAKYAVCLAKMLRASLSVIFVVNEKILQELQKSRVLVAVETKVYERDLEEQGLMFLERVKRLADSRGVTCTAEVKRGVVHEEVIKKVLESNADLLVMGQLKEIISRTEIYYEEGEQLFREAPCPVVIVKNTPKVDKLFKEVI